MGKTTYIVIGIVLLIILVYVLYKQGYINLDFLKKKTQDTPSPSSIPSSSGSNYVAPPQSSATFPLINLPISTSTKGKNLATAILQLGINKYWAKDLQKQLKVDGVFGPVTKEAAKNIPNFNGKITTTFFDSMENAMTSIGFSKQGGSYQERASRMYSFLLNK